MSRRFWSALASELTPYTPGEQPQHSRLLKLNTNESPFAPSSDVLAAIAATNGDELLRYPDPESTELRRVIAEYHGLNSAQVFLGNGSDEVLAHIFAGLLKHDSPLQIPDISYSFYPVWAQLYGVTIERVALADDFSINPDSFNNNAAAVIIPNPNAPTGIALPLSSIQSMLSDAPNRLLVIDEAYVDFGGESAVSLIAEHDNLLVVQTLSKSRALAGLRVGFALGQEELIEALNRVKNSFNSYPLDAVAQRGAIAALKDEDWFRATTSELIETREFLAGELSQREFEVLPSSANFVFVRHTRIAGLDLFNALRERGVIVRRWDAARIENHLRISIGTREQVDRLLSEIDSVLAD